MSGARISAGFAFLNTRPPARARLAPAAPAIVDEEEKRKKSPAMMAAIQTNRINGRGLFMAPLKIGQTLPRVNTEGRCNALPKRNIPKFVTEISEQRLPLHVRQGHRCLALV